ncbi:hypothetical protein HCB37_14510 [Listeria booriae]|uniref:hypothetical protein n=2 Tax=Listeria booriae TaxID=1552123 RepID=UPI001624354A|nr:hypothetical protein [Listeria booriae]MBC1558464.1 hypothetical protein [Listeria booriae]MBC1920360.1 hypothetical protein [Listeria booriae]MBC2025190.1 hypothetical protein [Listeria booriae]MBC2048880.1 hypothetical protein [Listeria booriae]MBC2265727.1 hypothetical protein [Listeria booriae]
MILREIRIFSDEDIPGEKPEEMFHRQAESMCSFFSSFLYKKKIRTKVKVINVECRSTEVLERTLAIDGFLDVCVHYDIKNFAQQSEQQKKVIQLEVIMLGLKKACNYLSLDYASFEEIQKEIIALNYQHHFIWKRPKFSPDRKRKVFVKVDWGTQKIDLTLFIEDKQGTILLQKAVPINHPGSMGLDILGKLKWLDNDTVELKHRYIKSEVYTFTV